MFQLFTKHRFIGLINKTGGKMKEYNQYTYAVVKDKDRNIIGILIRFKNEHAIMIPLIDIILEMEKII